MKEKLDLDATMQDQRAKTETAELGARQAKADAETTQANYDKKNAKVNFWTKTLTFRKIIGAVFSIIALIYGIAIISALAHGASTMGKATEIVRKEVMGIINSLFPSKGTPVTGGADGFSF